MAANVDKVPSIATSVDPPPQRSPDREEAPVAAASQEVAADFRLVIEEDKSTHTFVYKTVNRTTGEVVSQVPREEVLRMREAPDYVAGKVVQTKA